MGAQSHLDAPTRAVLNGSIRPPGERQRRCSGEVVQPGRWIQPRCPECGGKWGGTQCETGCSLIAEPLPPRKWREPLVRPCENGCNAWVPEVDYCAPHLPTPWLIVANRRAELWTEYAGWIWDQILSEVPGPAA